jgi:hypothetical protein
MDFNLKRAWRIDSVASDERGRIGLGKAIKAVSETLNVSPASYEVYVDAEGRILLEPLVSIPAREAWLYKNPTAMSMLRAGLESAAQGKIVTNGPQFKEFADTEPDE